MNRRHFLATAAGFAAAPALAPAAPNREQRLGVSIASYQRYRSRVASDRFPGWDDATDVLEHCAQLGAGCLQIGVRGWSSDFAGKVRDRREALHILLEGQVRLPRDDTDVERFRSDCQAAREAGATILRTVCLGGRRYETFETLAQWRKFQQRSWNGLTLAEPVMRKLGMKLAIENHKDWRTDEFLDLLKRLESEAVGVNFDFGNNLSLLEDPHDVCEALAPYILTTHVKDMGLKQSKDGFLLSEVPLGQGMLDVPRLIGICRKVKPDVQLNLEMITRDPLSVPVLSKKYWATMTAVPASDLAKTLRLVRDHSSTQPLPTVSDKSPEQRLAYEEDNVRQCFRFARERLGLA